MISNVDVKEYLSKVPEVTLFFWVIKVLATTVGETASDFLNVTLGLGLITTTIIAGVLLIIALFFQIKSEQYNPWLYWPVVILISIFGTLATDNLTDGYGVPLIASTIFFLICLIITFYMWHKSEGTLSIHSIYSRKRELFYWLAILFTFALGTAAGDLLSESVGLGYLLTAIIIIIAITIFDIGYRRGWNSVLSFWAVYIMTRPLGASFGDLLSQPRNAGGIGLGTTTTSFIFLVAILIVLVYLSKTKKDRIISKEKGV